MLAYIVMSFLVITFILDVIKTLMKVFNLLIGKLVHYTVDFNENIFLSD